MAILRVVGLDTAFVKDPAITLKDYIDTNYIISTPAKANVNFDTKFARLDKPNHIIIENMTYKIQDQILGAGRFSFNDIKRLQILCNSRSAKNDKFLMEQHVQEIINANPLGMQSDGIQWAFITDFTPLPMDTATTINVPEVESTDVARSFALVTMHYDKYKF